MEEHPSNILFGNEVDDFGEAMLLVIRQCDIEAACASNLLPDQAREMEKALANMRHRAEWALARWETVKAQMEAMLIAEFRAMGDDELSLFADSLESGEYHNLAI